MPALYKIMTPTGQAAFLVTNVLAVETYVAPSNKEAPCGVRLHLLEDVAEKPFINIPCPDIATQERVYAEACAAIEAADD